MKKVEIEDREMRQHGWNARPPFCDGLIRRLLDGGLEKGKEIFVHLPQDRPVYIFYHLQEEGQVK